MAMQITKPRARSSIFAARIVVLLLMGIIGALLPLSATYFYAAPSRSNEHRLDFGKLALSVEPNVGQAGPEVRFVAHAPGSPLYFSPSGVAIEIGTGRGASSATGAGDRGTEPSRSKFRALEPAGLGASLSMPDIQSSPTVVHMQFVGANPAPEITAGEQLPGKVNYFIGSDSNQWHSDLPTYGGVEYRGIYPGIDLKYEGTASSLKGTYTLSPGADPNDIRWRYDETSTATVDAGGNLMITYPRAEGGSGSSALTLTEQAPVAWQDLEGRRKPVSVKYVVSSEGTVSFALGLYDSSQPLIIDPTLTYSTYLGGNFAETGYNLAVDPAGNFYVTGYTNSSNFPTRNGFQPNYGGGGQDGFVAKFNAQGQPVYITYLGGNSIDSGYGIDADADGNAYVTGFTASANFPIVNAYQPNFGGGFYDAFVTKLNPSGSALIFSTYLGGSGHENSQGSGPQSGEIAVDAARNIYVAGYTTSANFPTRNAYQPANHGGTDLFITKFNPAANDLVWSTYLGGSSSDGPGGIAVDALNNVAVAGYTWSDDYPTLAAFQPFNAGPRDAFLSKINAAGSALIYSTYLGGHMDDLASDVDLDSAGNAYVAGFTDSTSFPLFAPYDPLFEGLSEAFVGKFTPAGAPVYSTYLGGGWLDEASGIAANEAGEAFVMGSTQSQNFPLMNPIDSTLGGSEDAFVTRFSSTGSALIFSTYLGGNDNRELQNGAALALDDANNIYISGDTGATDFPTTENAFQPFRASAMDAFVARISEQAPTATPTATGSPQPTPTTCIVGDYVVAQSTGAALVPGTTYLPNSACDSCTAPIAFPFPVRFYDQIFTHGRVSSEGYLQFTGNNPLRLNFCLPYGGIENAIHAFWDDLYIGGDGVYTSVSGVAPDRILNIEWRGELSENNEPISFEIRLYEGTGQIDLVYAQLGGGHGESATVGVQRDTGSLYTRFSCNQPLLSPGLKLTFTLPACLTPTNTPQTRTPTYTATATATPPTLLYSTYYGSWERDSIADIARDAAGNIYVAGTTFENDFNYGDINVAKFSPDGQNLLYQTILGGTRIDYGFALSVDAAGNATVAGIATSFDYPLLNPIQAIHAGGIYDVVMTRLNPSGGIVFSTYLGGSGPDYADGLATDAAGNIYLTGHTNSTNFPTTAGAFQTANQGFYDGFVTKVAPNGSAIVWSTYLGGRYSDESHDLALDAQGNVYLTGWTSSDNFPTLNPFQQSVSDTSGDAFVTKMNPEGSALIYSTYLGGSHPPGPGQDAGNGIEVDATGHAYVAGWTESPNFPSTLSSFQPYFRGYEDAFVTKLTPAGNALVYSTFLGGVGQEEGMDLALDGDNQAHVTGFTGSVDFPTVNAIQPARQDRTDAFVTKLNEAGSAAVYSTFLGGDGQLPSLTGDDTGSGILIDGTGDAVIGGTTDSYNFPVLSPFQGQSAGESDGFISKITGSNPGLTHTPTAIVSVTVTGSPTATPTPTPPSLGTGTPTPTRTTIPSSPTSTRTVTPPAGTPATTVSPSPTVCLIGFSDVRPGSTFYAYVQCLACAGIITGYSDGTFRPNNDVTRGQAAKIIANSKGYNDAIPPTQQTFSDVPSTSPFWLYIERVALHGAVSGYSDGTFRPSNDMTRGQLAKIDATAAGYNDAIPPTQQTFSDITPGTTFWLYIERAALHGVVSGYSDGTFRPSNNVTRGQASKIVSITFFSGCSTR